MLRPSSQDPNSQKREKPKPDTYRMEAVFRIRIRIDFGRLEPDPDPGGQKLPTKIEKNYVLKCWMFSLEGRRLLL
jgi:hypothetical protein